MSTLPGGQAPNVYPEHVNVGPPMTLPDGFPFDARSPIRRYTDPAIVALFPFTAGLTVMDDRIAAAVDQHSGFREEPWSRLASTADAAAVLVFGGEQESLDMAERLWQFHTTVQGSNEGIAYSANDADAQTWVLASVMKGTEETYRRWGNPRGEPLTPRHRSGVYQNFRVFGEVFGIKSSLMPATVEDLDTYWEDKLNGDELLRTDVSRRMAQAVFRYTSPKVPAVLSRVGQAIAVTSLDPRLQERAGIRQRASDTRIAAMVDVTMRNTYGRTPGVLREKAIPGYLAARRHIVPLIGQYSTIRTLKAERSTDGQQISG